MSKRGLMDLGHGLHDHQLWHTCRPHGLHSSIWLHDLSVEFVCVLRDWLRWFSRVYHLREFVYLDDAVGLYCSRLRHSFSNKLHFRERREHIRVGALRFLRHWLLRLSHFHYLSKLWKLDVV